MNGMDKIIEKIVAQAEETARLNEQNAKAECDALLKKAETEAAKCSEEKIAKAKLEAAEIIKRRKSVADLEARKMRLAVKQEIIQQCFDLALEKLGHLSEEDYIDFLAAQIVKIPAASGEIILNEKDKAAIGKKLVAEANRRLSGKAISLAHPITLSEETISAAGGFVLKNGDIELNNTLETIVSSVREDLVPEVVAALFE